MDEPADPATTDRLTGAWVEAWAVCRGPRVRVHRDGPAWVVSGLDGKRTDEVVLAGPDAEQVAHRAATLDAQTWLTLVTAEPWTAPPPAGRVVFQTHECLMVADLPSLAPAAGVAPYDGALLVVDGARATVAVRVDGEPAAEGTVGVVGDTAVLDRIRTSEAHRRRGLGSRVVLGLTAWAREQGATTGLLIASPEGQALYARLGWQRAAAVVTLVADEG